MSLPSPRRIGLFAEYRHGAGESGIVSKDFKRIEVLVYSQGYKPNVDNAATMPPVDVSDRHGICGLKPQRAGRLLMGLRRRLIIL